MIKVVQIYELFSNEIGSVFLTKHRCNLFDKKYIYNLLFMGLIVFLRPKRRGKKVINCCFLRTVHVIN